MIPFALLAQIDAAPRVGQNLVYLLLGGYMVIGYLAHQRWGLRLGGVLVLPFLAVYATNDLRALLLFGIAAVVTFTAGELLHRRTLIYGRRLLIAFLMTSLATTWALNAVIGISRTGILMPLIPGLFAYNLHRETRPAWNAVLFLAWLIGALALTYGILAVVG